MGIVQKSSVYSSIMLAVGILLGFLTAGLLLPNFFTEEENGLLSLLTSYSLIYAQITLIGISAAVIKFFPHFKNETNKHNGFLTFISLIVFASFLVFTMYYYFSKPFLKQVFDSSPLFQKSYFYILPLTFFTLYFSLFDAYSTANIKTVRGFFYKDVLQRLFVLISIGAYVLFKLNFNWFLFFYVISLCLPTVIFFGVLVKEKQFAFKVSWTPIYQRNWRYMAKISGYSLLLGISWVGVNNLDTILIERLIDLKSAGIYSRNMFFGVLVAIPYRAIHKISSGVIAHAFKENNLEQVKDVYYKSTLTQLILGAFIFGGLWINIDNIYQIIPESYMSGKYVIFFIALGNFFNMLGGVNTAVINFSPYYRWNSIFVGSLLFLVVIFNLFFIPIMGITGTAVATAISYFVYNFMMYVLLYKKYNFQPFSKPHLLAVIILVASFILAFIIPKFNLFLWDIVIRSTVFTIAFGLLIYFSKISPDINNLINQYLKKFNLPHVK